METTFAVFLRTLRKKKKKTQTSLAQQAGIAVRTLIYWEMGERQPRREEIENVLDALGATEAEKTRAYSLLTTPRGIQMVRESQETNQVTGFVADFGDLLMALRLRRGWTRDQVADTLGVSLSSLTRWEHSRVFPTEETLIRLCDLLGAAAEERSALLGRRHHSSEWTSLPSLDEAARLLTAWKQTLEEADAPLADLHALLLKRSLRLLAIHEPKAEHLLAQTEASHSLWLLYQRRVEEARRTAEYALQCSKTTYGKEAYWSRAVNVLVYCSELASKPSASQSVSLLQKYLTETSTPTVQRTLLLDSALYTARDGSESAYELLRAAEPLRKLIDSEGADGEKYTLRTSAKVKSYLGDFEGTFTDLTRLENVIPLDVHSLIIWVRTFLRAGDRQEAHRYLSCAYALLQENPRPLEQSLLDDLAKDL